VPEREHPAAKAGRFVRAAGRAGMAAARELERQNAARPKPVPVAPAPPAPPPPALRTTGFVGRTVYAGFILALVAFALVILRVETLFGTHNDKLVFKLVVAGVLLAEATLLMSNWRGANQRLGQRVLTRTWGPRGAITRREKTFARLIRDVIMLIGLAFLAAAVYELLSAL
jgi:hypothetical protein